MLPPNQIQKIVEYGLSLHQQGDFQGARINYEHALSIDPTHFMALQLMGSLLAQTKSYEAAIQYLSRAILLSPNFAPSHNNLGNVFLELRRLDEALLSYEKAIALEDNFTLAYNNRGNALLELRRLDEALLSYEKAIAIEPNYFEAYNNRGNLFKMLGSFDESVDSFKKSLLVNSSNAKTNWDFALLLLTLGHFSEGFKLYEWRWKTPKLFKSLGGVRSFTQPLWSGCEPLDGRTILIYAEQGLGDTIQFCRYASLVSNLGAKVLLEVQAPLVKLLSSIDDYVNVIPKGGALPSFDYQCPLLSLPLAFKTTLETIPKISKYIQADEKKVIDWEARLGKQNKPRVGIVWSGSLDHSNDQNRSIPLSELIAYLPPNFDYVCLQKELREGDKEALLQHPEIRWFGEDLNDFSDTAALCELMDVVVSVDTSVAHLAGALGKTAWVLIPFSPDWRWLLDRKDSPWYPSIKLFRQEEMGNWSSALKSIESELIGMNLGI